MFVDTEEEALAPREQDKRFTLVPCARGAADAMDVLVSARRQADLQDEGNVGEVQAAADDVGGEHHTCCGFFEGGGGACARGLREAGLELEGFDLSGVVFAVVGEDGGEEGV